MVKQILLLGLIGTWAFISCQSPLPSQPASPVKIILDTDIGPDFDDVGAVAVLHAMADSGKAEILGIMACNKDDLVVPTIEVFNTYFGRPTIPVGATRSVGVTIGATQHWPDSIVSRYPHLTASTALAPDAVTLYRKLLAAQPDGSVTIASIGFITNLSNLLQSPPDQFSKLSGKDLVALKVKRLVSMAGWFPAGREYNIYMDSVASRYCFEHWPTPIIFTGFEIGKEIKTGLKLVQSQVEGSPVKEAFRIAMAGSKDDLKGHMSWDQTAVLIALYGTDPFFSTETGTIIVNRDGSNLWKPEKGGKHTYVKMRMNPDSLGNFIEARMMHLPKKKR